MRTFSIVNSATGLTSGAGVTFPDGTTVIRWRGATEDYELGSTSVWPTPQDALRSLHRGEDLTHTHSDHPWQPSDNALIRYECPCGASHDVSVSLDASITSADDRPVRATVQPVLTDARQQAMLEQHALTAALADEAGDQ